MADVIEYPFDICYRTISTAVAKQGVEFVKKLLMNDVSETVANVIIKQALKRGWGS